MSASRQSRKRRRTTVAASAASLAASVALVGGLRSTGQAGVERPDDGERSAIGHAALPPTPALPDEPLSELLSGIEFVPDRSAFDGLMGDEAPDQLVAIAVGDDAELADAGLRIRAYRALALYPSAENEETLRAAVAEHGAVARGVDTLYVRAAMDALARVAPDDAVDAIAPMLAHPSQDVRAGAARALGATGRAAAEPVLRARLAEETVEQVRVAIADALRLLEGTEGTKEEP
ncbi:MAG TPA: HEAT repeat domain-containing protein [Kofleriaceae bacterium]|nr:HEAT repeat domain-containing protein [Kofleriaceae bacterium]